MNGMLFYEIERKIGNILGIIFENLRILNLNNFNVGVYLRQDFWHFVVLQTRKTLKTIRQHFFLRIKMCHNSDLCEWIDLWQQTTSYLSILLFLLTARQLFVITLKKLNFTIYIWQILVSFNF